MVQNIAIATFPRSVAQTYAYLLLFFPHSFQYICYIVCHLTRVPKYITQFSILFKFFSSISSLFSKYIIFFLTLSNIYHPCFLLSIIYYDLFLHCFQYSSSIPSLFSNIYHFFLILSDPHCLFSHSFPKMITYIFTLSTFIHPAFAFTENAIYFYSSRYFLHSIYHSLALVKK